MVRCLRNSVRLLRRAVKSRIIKVLRKVRSEPDEICRLNGRNIRIRIDGIIRTRDRLLAYAKIKEVLRAKLVEVAAMELPGVVYVELRGLGNSMTARAYLLYGRKYSFPLPNEAIWSYSLGSKEAAVSALNRTLEDYLKFLQAKPAA